MANEINLNVSCTVRDGYLVESFAPGNQSLDLVGPSPGGRAQLITTAESLLSFGDAASFADSALLILRNTDDSSVFNYITFGPETASGTAGVMVEIGRVYPGQTCVIFLEPGVVIRAKSALADAWLDMRIWEIEAGPGT